MAEPIAAPKSLRAYGETLPPDPSTPWREADFCVVDIETTGLDPAEHEIISFAALHIASGRLHLDDPLYQLVRPRRMPGRQTIVIHGLRSAELVDAPSFAEALGGLLEALTGRAMVAHVASIEAGFLGAAFRESGIRLVNPIIDTAALAAELFRLDNKRPPPRSLALTTLADMLGLPAHRPHQADGDALTTAQVFLALAAHLDQFSPQTVGTLERLSHRTPRRVPLRLGLGRLRRPVGWLHHSLMHRR
jgi:DNA polymerase-3 subunit epsilon